MIVEAGACLPSFATAAYALGLAGLSISPRHVATLTHLIGAELVKLRDDKVPRRRQRQLPPRVATTPEVVAVEVDGGRLRTREPGHGRGVHHKQNKEDKIACLITLSRLVYEQDPQPEPPPSFLQPRRVQRLVRQMGGLAGEYAQAVLGQGDGAELEGTAEEATDPTRQRWSPQRLVRTCVASMVDCHAFGPMVAAEAQERDFYRAQQRAFLGDGLAYNWTIQKGYFPDFEPIVDLLHVLCYVYTMAWVVGGTEAQRWGRYVGWWRCCWQGKVAEVIEEVRWWQGVVGEVPQGEELPESDPRCVVAATLSYLQNNQTRMDYPRYRRQGLPTTSSLVESLVGEFNTRLKDRRKFWNRPTRAETILQVRAALLSEDDRLLRYLQQRPGCSLRRRNSS
jgi:hypothetical protein